MLFHTLVKAHLCAILLVFVDMHRQSGSQVKHNDLINRQFTDSAVLTFTGTYRSSP